MCPVGRRAGQLTVGPHPPGQVPSGSRGRWCHFPEFCELAIRLLLGCNGPPWASRHRGAASAKHRGFLACAFLPLPLPLPPDTPLFSFASFPLS